MDDVKKGRRVICLGEFNDKNQLVATRIDIREGKLASLFLNPATRRLTGVRGSMQIKSFVAEVFK